MRCVAAIVLGLACACAPLTIAACGGATPEATDPSASSSANGDGAADDDAASSSHEHATPAADAASNVEEAVVINEPSKEPPSTMSYEEATATPEPLKLNDDRIQLTDLQLNAPMRGLIQQCRIPGAAKVTIRTAVQAGRAIGVTVVVDLNKPKPKGKPKKLTKAQAKAAAQQAKAEAKLIEKVRSCFDRSVRALTWPPSPRRDAFTTTF